MLNFKTSALCLLALSAVAATGCMGQVVDEADEPTLAAWGAEEAEATTPQKIILSPSMVIQATSGKCWKAYSTTTIILAACNPNDFQNLDPKFGWQVTQDLLIHSSKYWDRCIKVPSSSTGKLTLSKCDPNNSYQWFPFGPPPNDQGLICAAVQDAAGNFRCVSHKGTSYLYTAAPALAPIWYRHDP